MDNLPSDDIQSDIAIIGMSSPFTKAKTLDQFWLHLREDRECISFYSEKDLHSSGVNPVDPIGPFSVFTLGAVMY